MKTVAALLIAALLSASFLIGDSRRAYALGGESVNIQTFKTHSRLTLFADETVTVRWKNSTKGFEVFLAGLSLGDLGAPLGQEELWKAQFKSLNDPRMASIEFSETDQGVKILGLWKFPSGANELAHPKMESYDYRLQSPPRYVVDFWTQKGSTRAEAMVVKKHAERLASLKRAEADQKSRVDRHLASEKKKADIENIGKFCEEPLNEKKDVFLPFFPVHEKMNFSRWFSVTTADNEFNYYEPKTKARDAQYVRLALSLYREGNPALVIKTIDFMDKESPDSVFRREMRFLRANALIKLGMNTEAEQLLIQIMTGEKETPVALHAVMYLASKKFNEGAYLAALENFMWLSTYHGDHRLAWVFHLGAAECLYELKQTERASKEYQWAIENAKTPKDQAESALRVGDLTMQRFHYAQALGTYSQGIHHFETESASFPQVYINKAESLYGLGEHELARQAFLEFLQKFPSHPSGWRSTYRLGEIFGRKEGPAAVIESRKWFYETINRYPFSPGATIARLRLIPCGDHGGFDPEAQEKFFSGEAAKFSQSDEVSLGRYQDLRAIAHVRALITTGQEGKAVGKAIDEIKSQRSIETRGILGEMLTRLFRKHILNLLASGKKVEALAFYQDKISFIPHQNTGVDPDFILKLSQAASDLGLGKVAQQLIDTHAKLSREGRSVAAEGDGIEDALKSAEKHFTQAEALWTSDGIKAETVIRDHLGFVKEESSYSYGRELILGLLDQKTEKNPSALSHALKAQLLLAPSEHGLDDQLRISQWVADLEIRTENYSTGFEMLRNIEKLLKLKDGKKDRGLASVLGVPPLRDTASLVLDQGDVLERMGRWGEAAATYSRAVEKGWGGNKASYGYARALIKTGEVQNKEKARLTLQKLAGSKTEDFWAKLAQEALAEEKTRETVLGDAKEGKR